MFPNRIQVDFRCFSAASFWDHFFLAFSTGGGEDLDGTGRPGGVGLGVRERACGGKGGGREEEEEEEEGGGGGRREEEHNSPVPVRAYGLENRSHARLALKKGDRS